MKRTSARSLTVMAAAVTTLAAVAAAAADTSVVHHLDLDGRWEAGLDRRYDRALAVPGLATDPTKPTPGTLWYRRTVTLPPGRWTAATLTLKGARFAPSVYVDGRRVSTAEGGMAPTTHRFALAGGAAPRVMTIEIALKSLRDVDPADASATPAADRWRSNVSSMMWDSVVLRLHGDASITRVTPWPDVSGDAITAAWAVDGARPGDRVALDVLEAAGEVLASAASPADTAAGRTTIALHGRLKPWSPESPNVYRLRTRVVRGDDTIDETEQSVGLREFAVRGRGFVLNGKPIQLRMGTVVWPRWSRDPEAERIAFDTKWFETNVVRRLKDSGANALRFHLGLPPEPLLDLCDRHGLAVQMEWPFFHGVAASRASMTTQWAAWMDVAARHPCVAVVQAWNETDEPQLVAARAALAAVLADRPPVVVNHRDVSPVHKYWWSLFENLGLYYDSADQFDKPVIADEFGGNYLDGDANPGLYPETKSAFLRFLGHNNTATDRLDLHADSNARVAEYWRRLGVAGYSPFCILGSPHDGSHWFLGPTNVAAPTPKPVWAALAAALAPRSVSLELWNRNFTPGETITTPLWFFNDTDAPAELTARIDVAAEPGGARATPVRVTAKLGPFERVTQAVAIPLPATPGEWRVSATLENLSPAPPSPVTSSWHVRTLVPQVPAGVRDAVVGIAADEGELRQMLAGLGVRVTTPDDAAATVLAGGRSTWARLRDHRAAREAFDRARHRGVPVVLLDAGPQPLGVGYAAAGALGGPREGAPKVANPAVLETTPLFGGVSVSFKETAEPESTLQQPADGAALWRSLPKQATWLWNGLRGGLIVPAADLHVDGLSGPAMLAVWQQRGADPAAIKAGRCFAYALADYYAFADKPDDAATADALRRRVKFLVEDAPALAGVVNAHAPIVTADLGALYRGNGSGEDVLAPVPLASAGKNLSRTPVVMLRFRPGIGSVTLSQLLTHGRLGAPAEAGPGVYGLRYDPAAVQVVLNLIANAIASAAAP